MYGICKVVMVHHGFSAHSSLRICNVLVWVV